MGWFQYAFKRIITGTLLLFGASIIVFLIIHIIPGDPAEILAGTGAPEQAIEAMRERFGLNRPLWVQYLDWLQNLFRGNFGKSLISGKPVSELLLTRYPRSIELMVLSLTIALTIAIPAGIVSGVNRNTNLDYLGLLFSQFGVSIPSFWLGLVMILIFAKILNLLPPSGYVPLQEDIIGNLQRVAMPAFTLGIINAAIITRYLRSSILDELNKDYVRTARAYGHSEKRIIRKYILKNAMIPTITIIGLQIGWLIGASVIVEMVFNWAGVGLLLLNGIISRNYTVIQPALLSLAATFIISNMMVDLLYGWLDPKIKY